MEVASDLSLGRTQLSPLSAPYAVLWPCFPMYVCIDTCYGGPALVLGVRHLPLALHCLSETGFLTDLGLTDYLGRLPMESQGSPCFYLPVLELQTYTSMFGFDMNAGDLNSGPHVWAVSS